MDDLPGREKARLTGAIACGAKASENKGKSENGDDVLSRNRNKLIITSRLSPLSESRPERCAERDTFSTRPPLSPVATDNHKQKSWRIAQRLLLSLLFLRRQLLVIKALIGGVPTHHYVLPRAPFSFRSSARSKAALFSNGVGRRGQFNSIWTFSVRMKPRGEGLVRDHPSSWLYADRQCKISNSPAKPIAFGAMDDGEQDISVFSLCDGPVLLAIRLLVGISPRSRTLGAVQTVSDPASQLN
ncbi:hypothetical protein B0H11DRAFT_1940401 [Mycena galericulata]|nr:hypothetical protein B0H11DRAFT_1940401 [Mycena galericulata]